ncbi:MAG: protein kinase [Phototrophicaceae bacterium]
MDVGALVNEQYKIIEHIGRGGMADVWSARDTRLRRMVAIKTIVSGLSKDLDPVELFKREAHTIAQMEHPHILPIYDFGEYENNLYIVMRYVTGGSLEDLLRDGAMDPQDVLRMGDAIGQALDYAHSNNVIHLDLKPPNILLDSSGAPYLADFGLATVLDPEGRARNPGSGTLLYMAPEQMMSDTIDHHADIYSFCIMLYHMLTGSLPFDGNIPLSMSQLQRDVGLPNLEDQIGYLPPDLTDLLRLGTTADPKFRPKTHMEIMDQFRNILQPTGVAITGNALDDPYDIHINPYDMLTEVYGDDIPDADLLEAIDIYTRARYDWQSGQGRFLLGVTNFILMSDYYQNAGQHNLRIDTAGYQVLLRGAIEYDYELEYWWYKLNDDDRRWVCLHALRSGNTPARMRALYRLETLPDEQGTAVIPRLVAQALEVETDDNAKLAALKVLGTRVQLMKQQQMRIKTEYRGRLITSMTRLGIEVAPRQEWRESAYSDDVDVLIAEQAFDESPDVAEFAARTVGRIRSLVAIEHLSNEQQNQRSGALEALAFVRDEAPNLPDIVKPDARFYAWITNTFRRLTQNPIELIANIALVFVMGWIAMGNHIWGSWGFTVGSLGAQRWTNTVALGVIFGLMMSLTYVLTVVISERLQGFWTWWMRLIVSGILGFGISILSFTSYRYFFLQEALFEVLWDQMRFAGAALALGLIATTLLRLKAWQGVLLTTASTFIAIFAIYRGFYFPESSDISLITLFTLGLGIVFGWRAVQLTKFEAQLPFIKIPLIGFVVGSIIGLLWTAAMWGFFINFLLPHVGTPSFTWDTVSVLAGLSLLLGLIASYYLTRSGRIGLGLAAIISFSAAYMIYSPQFFDYNFSVPLVNPTFDVQYAAGTALIPTSPQPLIWYRAEQTEQVFTLTLPFLLVIALGMNLPQLLGSWWQWIGAARSDKERGAWMTGVLGYVMVITALVSILTLYSPQINRIWELSWSFWAFMTFIFAMATLRWTKWGANGLIMSGLILIIGGFAFDALTMFQLADAGIFPTLLSPVPQLSATLQRFSLDASITEYHLWGIWAGVLGIFVWGAQRKSLWGGIGLVAMLCAWFLVVFSSSIQGSIAIFAITNVALVYFVLHGKYEIMETSRLQVAWLPFTQNIHADVPETLIHLPDAVLPSAPATALLPKDAVKKQILADDMQTKVPSMDDLRDLETIDFGHVPAPHPNDMDTAPQIQINTDDLKTAFPQAPEFMAFDTTDDGIDKGLTHLQIKIDTSSMRQTGEISKVDDDDKKPSSNLTDIKINLDTSALGQANKPIEDDAPKKAAGGLTDIKINLDTSALKPKDDANSTDVAKPIFKFDASNVINQNTVQFDPHDDTEEDDDEETIE